MDFGKFLYQQKKKTHDSKKKQKQFQVKEVKFRPNIDDHDYDVKLRNALRFLEEGDKVKATVQFRGREMSKPELGLNLMKRLAVDIGERGVQESTPEMAGNRMHLIFGPARRKRNGRERRPRPRAGARARPPGAAPGPEAPGRPARTTAPPPNSARGHGHGRDPGGATDPETPPAGPRSREGERAS